MLPVPLNSSKIIWSALDPVSIRQLAMIVSDPACSTFRAAPNICFGTSSALASKPPDMVRPLFAYFFELLNARPSLVIESRSTTTSLPASSFRFARSIAIMPSSMCSSTSWSFEDARTSAGTVRLNSVTSSGRSSMRRATTSMSG